MRPRKSGEPNGERPPGYEGGTRPRASRRSLRLKAAVACLGALGMVGGATLPATAGASTRGREGTGHAKANAYNAKITYWFWGESDIPGITKWMKQRISTYEKLHPKVSISLVPQSNTTIISSFRLASQSRTGPDIDTQWATMPTLTPVFGGDVLPISDYVTKSDLGRWTSTNENTYKNKVWAMPLYLIGIPLVWNKALFKKAGLDPNVAPKTWAQFLNDCKVLKAHGITPFGMGNKDGYFGAWMFAIYLRQELNSVAQLSKGVADVGNGEAQLSAKLKKLYTMLQSFVGSGYVNSNVASLTLDAGWQLFPQKKVAMSFTTDGNVLSWAKSVGEKNIGVARPPIWGTGKLASVYDVTQSSDEFITSWTKNPVADATFLQWLHTKANMVALNKETGAFPADSVFPVSSITDALARQLYKLDTAGKSVWLENYIPPQIDSDADIPAGQLVISGSGSPAKAVSMWQTELQQWRVQQVKQYQQYKSWANS